MNIRLTVAVGSLALAMIIGCGGEEPRTDFPQEDQSVAFAKGVRSDMVELQQQFRRPDVGVDGLGPIVESNVENYESIEEEGEETLGQHRETYLKIRDNLMELHEMVQSGASRQEVGRKINELVALAETLPGGAEGEGEDDERLEPIPEP